MAYFWYLFITTKKFAYSSSLGFHPSDATIEQPLFRTAITLVPIENPKVKMNEASKTTVREETRLLSKPKDISRSAGIFPKPVIHGLYSSVE